jgi:hypothetical protein
LGRQVWSGFRFGGHIVSLRRHANVCALLAQGSSAA